MSSVTGSKSHPTIFFIFGGTGVLTSRRLVPALYNLFLDGWMPDHLAIVAMGRTAYTDDQFREELLKDLNQFSRSGKVKKEKWDVFSQYIYYQVSDINEASTYEEQAR